MDVEPMKIENREFKPYINLPDEIYLSIFSFLDFFELIAAECTCHQWKCIAGDSSLWKAHYLKHSDGWCPEEKPDSWKVLIKRTFYLERCMWEYQKCLGDKKFPTHFDHQKKRLESKINHFSYLKSAENTIYFFYNLCGGPQFFYQLPVSDRIFDPSIFQDSKSGHWIYRDRDTNTINFSASWTSGNQKFWGYCTVFYSDEQRGVTCTFYPYVRCRDDCPLPLTRDGIISDPPLFQHVRWIIQTKIAQQLGITVSSPSLSCPRESTPDRLHAWSLGL